MSVSAFFDESGKFRDHKVIALGAVASYSQHFKDFAQNWGRLLRENGLKYFSAKNAFAPNRPFGEKNPALGVEKRIAAIEPFVAAIRKDIHVISGAVVDVRAFRKLPPHFFQFFGHDPAYIAFMRCIMRIAEHSASDQVSLIFDEDEQTVEHFYKLYRRIKQKWPDTRKKLAAISFADDKVVVSLQAADLVGALYRLEWSRKWNREKYDYRPLYKALTLPPQRHERLWGVETALGDKAHLIELADSLKDEWKKAQENAKREE